MKQAILSVLVASTVAVGPRIATAQTSSHPEEAAVRALIKTFADARNAHDGPAVAALYSDDGEWLGPKGSPRIVVGRPALAKMWSAVPGQVERTIQSIDFPGNNIAIVRVATQYPDIGRHNETFVIIKERLKWEIRVHQTVD
jgi:uncharacterized protein (TIGR02246 family)